MTKHEQTRIAVGAKFQRTMSMGKVDEEKRSVEVAFSSDVELKRWGEIEILSHESGAVDMTRMEDGAAVLFNHDWDKQIGVVESARIDSDGKGRAVVRFGSGTLASEKFRDVQDGILKHISVGYKIEEVKLTETRDDGTDVYTVTRWQPYEISFVTVPADTSVGVGRDLREQAAPAEPAQKIQPSIQKNIMSEPASPTVDVVAERKAAADAEHANIRQIVEIGQKYNLPDLAQSFISERKSVSEFKEAVLSEMEKRTKALQSQGTIGMSDKEAKRFSFVKLIRHLSDPKNDRFRGEAGYELEVCAEAEKHTTRAAKGIVIPTDVLRASLVDAVRNERGDIISIKTGSGYTGTGSATVSTQLLASSFVDLLRPRTFLLRRASVLGGLVGNIDIPKQTTGASGGWIGEDDNAPQTDVDFGLISLNPKTAAAYVDITRKMVMQSSLDVEALVRADLAKGLAQMIDLAGLYGTGSGYQPKGLKNYDGINAVDFANVSPTHAELVAMESAIAADNADAPSMAYVVNSAFRGYAKSTLKFSGIAGTIWEPGDTLNGYGTEVTNQVAAGDVFFGNWSDLWAAFWGGLELSVDPYTNSKKGRISLTVMQDCDFAVRRPESFTYGKQLTP